ncbi:MAG: hypothetical protein Q9213_008097, partial [Squamulea squamosa]
MDDTNLKTQVPAFSNAATLARSPYDPVQSPIGSCYADTFDSCSDTNGAYKHFVGISTSKPPLVGGDIDKNNPFHPGRSSPTMQMDGASNSSSTIDLAEPKSEPKPPARADPSLQFPDGGLDAWLVNLGC